jgi:uncharacterized membrane protein (DUF106 family)
MDFGFLLSIPNATLFMFLLAGGISSLTTAVNRLLTDPAKARAARKEVADWNKSLREAQKKQDKKTVEKLMKQQQHIMQLNTKMAWQSMKVSLLFIVPLFIIWQFLGGFFSLTPVAYFPGIGPILPIPLFNISLIWWYLLCSMLFGTILSHAFGLITVE